MLDKVMFSCGHSYPWILAGKNGSCVYCDGEYPDGTKCSLPFCDKPLIPKEPETAKEQKR